MNEQEDKGSEFGDFEEIKTQEEAEKEKESQQEQQVPTRVRMPRQGQFVGIVIERLGGKRMSIKTTDNKVRNCRVPGRFSRKFWLRPGNIVMIEPWKDDDEKGDVVYQYRPPEITQLKKRGVLDNLNRDF